MPLVLARHASQCTRISIRACNLPLELTHKIRDSVLPENCFLLGRAYVSKQGRKVPILQKG